MGLNPPRKPPKPPRLRQAEAISEYVDCDGWPVSAAESSAGMMFDVLAQAWCMVRCPRCARREKERRRRLEFAEAGEVVPERTQCRDRILATLEAGGMSGTDAAVMAYWLEILEDGDCPRCGGSGWEGPVRITEAMRTNPEITAFPTGSSQKGRGAPTVVMDQPDAEEITRCGGVGNLLGKLREQDPVAAEALELFRDPAGMRLAVLWPMTESGRAVLAANGDATRELRDAADHEAATLLAHATRLWNALVDEVKAKQAERRRRQIEDEAAALLGRGES